MNEKIAIIMPKGIQYDYCIKSFHDEDFNLPLIIRLNRPNQNLKKSLKIFVKSFLIFTQKQRLERLKINLKKDSELLLKQKLNCEYDRINEIELESFNQEYIASELKKHKIEYCIIWGCPILKSNIISSVSKIIFNAHTSILPYYKGSFSEFWQFFHDDFDKAGITIHQVDQGIDSGDIFYQIPALISDCINPYILRAYNSVRIARNYSNVVKQVINKKLAPQQQSIPNEKQNQDKIYKMKDITIDKEIRVYMKQNKY